MKRKLTYRYVLGGTLLLYLLIILAPFRDVTTPVRVAVLGVLLLLTVRTRRRGRHVFVAAAVLSGSLVVATIVAVVIGSTTVLICVGQASTVVLVLASIFVLGQTIIASGVVDGKAVGGVLCIYLLLGLALLRAARLLRRAHTALSRRRWRRTPRNRTRSTSASSP